MKRRKRLFVFVCCIGFIALLSVYALGLFDIIMPKGETYVDPENGVTLSLPGTWYMYDSSGTGLPAMSASSFHKGKDFYVSYSWEDFATEYNLDVPRSSIDNSYISMLNLLDLPDSAGKYITVNNTEYFLFEYPYDDDTVFSAYRIDKGILYEFSCIVQNIFEKREFHRLLSIIQYPETMSNNTSSANELLDYTGAFKAATKVTNIVSWLNAGIILALFLLSLNICRSALLKYRLGKKNALFASLIITLFTAAAIAFAAYWCGFSLWLSLEAAALGFITYKVTTSEKMRLNNEEIDY